MLFREKMKLAAVYAGLVGIVGGASGAATSDTTEQLWILNAEGDDIHVYEIGTWELIRHLKVGPNPHGISATADGRTVHIAIEAEEEPAGELVWIDTSSFEIEDRIEIGFEPNESECTPDGRWIYVPCNDGYWWVINGGTHEVAKKIWTGGQPHNTTISPDGKTMYLSPMGFKTKIDGEKVRVGPERVFIVDIDAGHQIVGDIPFRSHPRPVAITADGKRLFQNVDDLTGFQVADLESREVVKTVKHSINEQLDDRDTRCHGLAIRPDQREIWCADVDRHRIHVHEMISGEYRQIDTIPVLGRVYWLTFTPDGRYAFASIRSEGMVTVIDATTHDIVRDLRAGRTPKRTQVVVVPTAGK